MEELVQRVDLLIEVISRNSIPVIIEILGVFVPILISILLLLQDCRYNKRNIELQKQIEQSNEKLQRELSLRDECIQMREEFLKIYDDFCLFQRVIGCASMQVHIIFLIIPPMEVRLLLFNGSINSMTQQTQWFKLLIGQHYCCHLLTRNSSRFYRMF